MTIWSDIKLTRILAFTRTQHGLKMLVTTLPNDGLRPILRCLDLDSLVNLYATFDRAMQRSLSAPNALLALRFEKVAPRRVGMARYFLRAARDVYRLELAENSDWSAASYSLFQTLNPVELVLGQSFASGTLVQVMDDFSRNPRDEQLSNWAKMLPRTASPTFASSLLG